MITEAQIADFVKACEQMRYEYFTRTSPILVRDDRRYAHVGYTIGRKYARLTTPNGNVQDGSAWAFVDMQNGDILKPASWAAPAKHARGNIKDGIKGMGPHGPAYLR